ncbi:hypothetical protein T02_14135 [Trichinella nativa]|uniref:Uncharacterized protein n=1 Tax=Trichinella nativa TaxID=6335 RepID=A0A0V1L8I4_9BILA|nr:hypothetical protein T02_14135 [Trichinella nativa]
MKYMFHKKQTRKYIHALFVKKLVTHFLRYRNSKCRNLALRSSLPTLDWSDRRQSSLILVGESVERIVRQWFQKAITAGALLHSGLDFFLLPDEQFALQETNCAKQADQAQRSKQQDQYPVAEFYPDARVVHFRFNLCAVRIVGDVEKQILQAERVIAVRVQFGRRVRVAVFRKRYAVRCSIIAGIVL